jgi:predicted DCC family thiol-disulfide oxidoreductase YuxK
MNFSSLTGIILFDGVCNLCNTAVDFIIKRDKHARFKFGALQDNASKEILEQYSINKEYLESLILIQDGKVYYKSTAALEIAKSLKGLWPLFYPLILIPEFVRNPIYDWIARNRYRWFGKKEICRIPTAEEQSRFLSQ